jgi:hypothetical protein
MVLGNPQPFIFLSFCLLLLQRQKAKQRQKEKAGQTFSLSEDILKKVLLQLEGMALLTLI